jgi:hypothetical protein
MKKAEWKPLRMPTPKGWRKNVEPGTRVARILVYGVNWQLGDPSRDKECEIRYGTIISRAGYESLQGSDTVLVKWDGLEAFNVRVRINHLVSEELGKARFEAIQAQRKSDWENTEHRRSLASEAQRVTQDRARALFAAGADLVTIHSGGHVKETLLREQTRELEAFYTSSTTPLTVKGWVRFKPPEDSHE